MNCITGKVDLEELISAFKDLGLDIDVDEARNLLSRWVNYPQLSFVHVLIRVTFLAEWTRMAA